MPEVVRRVQIHIVNPLAVRVRRNELRPEVLARDVRPRRPPHIHPDVARHRGMHHYLVIRIQHEQIQIPAHAVHRVVVVKRRLHPLLVKPPHRLRHIRLRNRRRRRPLQPLQTRHKPGHNLRIHIRARIPAVIQRHYRRLQRRLQRRVIQLMRPQRRLSRAFAILMPLHMRRYQRAHIRGRLLQVRRVALRHLARIRERILKLCDIPPVHSLKRRLQLGNVLHSPLHSPNPRIRVRPRLAQRRLQLANLACQRRDLSPKRRHIRRHAANIHRSRRAAIPIAPARAHCDHKRHYRYHNAAAAQQPAD